MGTASYQTLQKSVLRQTEGVGVREGGRGIVQGYR